LLTGSAVTLVGILARRRTRRARLRIAAHFLTLFSLLLSSEALAYTTSSIVTDGCHERITMDAVRRVRSELPGAGIVAPTSDEEALIADVPFDLDSDMGELGAVTMLLGNRDVDLLGHEPDDLDELAPIHGDPSRQDEHCLRTASDDEPQGSTTALERCRATIASRVGAGLDALDAAGAPDPARRLEVEVFLELRGSVDAPLPAYHVEVGRALHTLQDGFSHVYRNPANQELVTVVLNYVDFAEERLDERVDGPPHNSELDRCVDLDAFRAERFELAKQASYELIKVTLEPDVDVASKRINVDEVLARYLSLDTLSACTFDNGWCSAPEKQYSESRGCVCDLGRGSAPSGTWVALAALALALTARRARRRPRHAAAALVLVGAVALPSRALAAEPEMTTAPAPADAEPAARPPTYDAPTLVDTTPDTPERDRSKFGAVIAGGGALQNGAFAASVGGLFRLNAHWLFGVDAEYNPWFSLRDFDVKKGSTNFYATGVLRYPLHFQRVNLRTTLQLGISRMNFALFGVPEGSVGPYVGFNLLGVDYEVAHGIFLIVNPAHIAIPIPKLSGTPFYYPQYRFTLGLQFGG
jgi:hypothetical protein